MQLKYLFTAIYKNGATYVQNPEDQSIKEPGRRSCFFDINHDELVAFVLKGNGHEYLVDLTDGHFEIDGVPFRMHQEPDLYGFKLIFFRQHTHSFIQTREKDTELSHEVVYRMGWECVLLGKKFQYEMLID